MAAVAPNLVCFGACREASQQMWCNNHTSVVGSIAKPLLCVGWWLSSSGNNNSSRFQGNNSKAREDYYGNNFAGGATSSISSRGVSRLHYCVVAAALAGPRAKDSLLVEAEERWQRALTNPLDGVSFTYEEFSDALSKYDFSFEVGDLVIQLFFSLLYITLS
jgi:hypothetical protein